MCFCFFFNDTATTEIYTLSLHDALPIAKLAREAEIAYATMALVTDYDCWREEDEAVSVEMVIENLQKNATNARMVVREAVRRLQAEPFESIAHSALKTALFTRLDVAPPETVASLKAILEPYL